MEGYNIDEEQFIEAHTNLLGLQQLLEKVVSKFESYTEYTDIDPEIIDEYEDLTIKEHVDKYISEGYKPMDAIKVVSKERKMPKGEIYTEYHKEK